MNCTMMKTPTRLKTVIICVDCTCFIQPPLLMHNYLGIPKEYLLPTNKSIWKDVESQNSSKLSSTVKFSFIETSSNYDKYNSTFCCLLYLAFAYDFAKFYPTYVDINAEYLTVERINKADSEANVSRTQIDATNK